MSNPRFRWALTGILLACLALFPAAVLALNVTCGERGGAYRAITRSDGILTFYVETDDAINWHAIAGKTKVKIDTGKGFEKTKSKGSFHTPKNVKSFRIKVASKNGKLGVSCLAGPTKAAEATVLGLAANSQTLATNTGLSANSKGRFNLGGNITSKDLIYVSTSNGPSAFSSGRFLPPDWSAWASVEGRSYSGGIDGASIDFVGGVDRLVRPDLLIGVLAGYGRTIVSDVGTPEVVNSPMIGVYLAKNYNNTLIINGFASYARPQNEVSGASFLSSRLSVGLNMTGQIERSGTLIEPFFYARGFSEDQPGYTTGLGAVIAADQTTSFAAALGVKVNFTGLNTQNAMVPYASAAADYRRTTSLSGASDTVIAPRIAFGIKGELGAGQVSLDLDIGKTRSDTFDRGVKFGYEVSF